VKDGLCRKELLTMSCLASCTEVTIALLDLLDPSRTRAAHGGLTAQRESIASHRVFAVLDRPGRIIWPSQLALPLSLTLSMPYPFSCLPFFLSPFFALCLTRELPLPLGPSSRPPHASLVAAPLRNHSHSNLRFSKSPPTILVRHTARPSTYLNMTI
jgi:hypothetical protein